MDNKDTELIARMHEYMARRVNKPRKVEKDGTYQRINIDDCNNDGWHTVIDNIVKKDTEYKQQVYDYVNHPKHYNNYQKEVIEMMENIWGIQATILFCEMNAFKYRMRMGTKPGNDIAEDLKKEKWYLDKANELRSKAFDLSIDMDQ